MPTPAFPPPRVQSPTRLWSGGSPSPSQRAPIFVTMQTTAFNQALTRFAESFKGDLSKLVLVHALDLLARVQPRTPVDTSRLKNSEHVVPPNASGDTYVYQDKKGRSFNGALDGAKTGPFLALVGTNVPYALPIEAGHSKQAPAGMFGISVREKWGELERDAAQAMQARWKQV